MEHVSCPRACDSSDKLESQKMFGKREPHIKDGVLVVGQKEFREVSCRNLIKIGFMEE